MNDCYLFHILDDDKRFASTSGGFFYMIASQVIERYSGVVFGASFDNNYNVRHIAVENKGDLFKLQGSKYPQSDTSGIFALLNDYMNAGRYILFSGTPCQCAAVKQFISGYKRIILVDMICYGVASPKVWNNYLSAYFDIRKIKGIRFKDKRFGWKNWHTCIELEDKKHYLRGITNPFMNHYMNGLYVRPSCTSCPFKGNNRYSDITMGDAWGKGEDSDLNDDKGLSIVMIHSRMGSEFFNDVCNLADFKKVDFNEYIRGNPYYYLIPEFDTEKRKNFFEFWHKRGFRAAFNRFCLPHGIRRFKYYYLRNRKTYRK